MAEEADNLVLKILREIREEVRDHSRHFIAVERQLADIKETLFTSAGMAAHANIQVEQMGQRVDELEDRVNVLQKRLAQIEAKQ
jgi:uncharacterized protein YceH (UPF0502 family)